MPASRRQFVQGNLYTARRHGDEKEIARCLEVLERLDLEDEAFRRGSMIGLQRLWDQRGWGQRGWSRR